MEKVWTALHHASVLAVACLSLVLGSLDYCCVCNVFANVVFHCCMVLGCNLVLWQSCRSYYALCAYLFHLHSVSSNGLRWTQIFILPQSSVMWHHFPMRSISSWKFYHPNFFSFPLFNTSFLDKVQRLFCYFLVTFLLPIMFKVWKYNSYIAYSMSIFVCQYCID